MTINNPPPAKPLVPSLVTTRAEYKLEPIASLISQLLQEKFKTEARFSFEHSPDWLTSTPDKSLLNKHWPLVQQVYAALVDNKYNLDERLELVKKPGNQYFDIWFHEPYSFAVEFDESQHFNQFRLAALNHYHNINVAFDIQLYKSLNNVIKNPGSSGFQKLRTNDPLFPPILQGEKQDNRIRQRALRDFLKDLLPMAMGLNPTVRIPYHVVNKKINSFNETDLRLIKDYLNQYNALNTINLI